MHDTITIAHGLASFDVTEEPTTVLSVREQKVTLTRGRITEEQLAKKLQDKFMEVQSLIDQKREGSRMWKLSNRYIYGTDANDRMARTSKMNMIMHGDGHGGVHHHDGFLNVNGIFEGRFDIILTNPPFGANVEPPTKCWKLIFESIQPPRSAI